MVVGHWLQRLDRNFVFRISVLGLVLRFEVFRLLGTLLSGRSLTHTRHYDALD